MASAPQLRRLQRVEVDGLFGLYDHRIDLELNDRVTFLHGPNGVGKTTILKMIDAALKERFDYFQSTRFKRLLLGFDDGAELEFNKDMAKDGDAEIGELRLATNGEVKSTAVSQPVSDAASIAAEIWHLKRDGDVWLDIPDFERLTNAEVVQKYGRTLSAELARRDVPWLREFLDTASSHFIEAQRLVRSQYMPRWPHRLDATPSRVVECSADLKRRIGDTMAEYGRQAQVLDQSFPQRLLQRGGANDNLSIEEIQSQMFDLGKKIEELKDIGILDEAPIQTVGDMEKSQAGVMTLYVNDTAKKLQVLEDLANRARLLLKSLNGKFQHKQMQVDRDKGLIITGEHGDSLPPDSLSSGEQHELILHYDLLFSVAPNTVVLLDEPELSLHLEWQTRFLSDLVAIVKLSSFDALVATHSPSIVGERDDLMVELGG